MKPFDIQKILIPIDFSETSFLAIEHAANTAKLFNAELILLHVIEKHWEKFSIVAPEIRIEAPDAFITAIEDRLEEIVADISSKYGVKSACVTSSDGSIFNEIIAMSTEHNVDLIVMGTHGVSGVEEFFIGSNTYKVVTQSICPVISVQNHATKTGFSNIVLPIDDSAHSRQKINHAITIAKHFSSKLHILGLADYNEEDDNSEFKKFEIKLAQIEDYAKKCGVMFICKILKGNNQAKLTLDYAASVNADLIVIMTDQDEDLSGRFLGPYAQQVVNHSKVPVMSVPPIVTNDPWQFT